MTETLQHTTELTPEEEKDRLEIIENAIAGRAIDLCTKQGYNFGDPRVALNRAKTTSNID
jgi:hypothetical protein